MPPPPAPRLIALLRAINVGGHTVKMDHLRRLFAGLGLTGVETFIASGNVIFAPPPTPVEPLEGQIEAHLHTSLGYEVATFIRTAAEIAATAHHQPFPTDELEAPGHTLYVAFLRQAPPEEAQQRLLAMRGEADDFCFHARELFWLVRTSFHTSKFSGALLEKTLRMPATVRNITTVRKLAAKYPPAE